MAHAADRRDLGRARTISIFHTTDLHGRILPASTYEGLDGVGGLASCATCIRQWRRESLHSLTGGRDDCVVSVESARTTGAVSEIAVPATHTKIHHHPQTVAELRRILTEHLREAGP